MNAFTFYDPEMHSRIIETGTKVMSELKENYALFLDDVRFPGEVSWVSYPERLNETPWLIARNYTDFCNLIKDIGVPYFVSFDHDLEFEHYANFSKFTDEFRGDGNDCLKFLIQHCKETGEDFPLYRFHSQNPDAVTRMRLTLLRAGSF